LITADLKPGGRAGSSPMRITWASLARSEPLGLSRLSVSWLIGARSLPSDIRSGAPIGGAANTAAVTPACQSSSSTSTTAVGRTVSVVAGKTALATPAASAVASPPPTRIVFFVAVEGKPSFAAASSSPELVPSWGGRLDSSPRLQPANATAASSPARVSFFARTEQHCSHRAAGRGPQRLARSHWPTRWLTSQSKTG
jgi:hypothetical protein